MNDFTQVEILNFDLFDYLLKTYESNTNFCNAIFSLLSTSDKRSLEFIENYWTFTENKNTFVKLLMQQWPEFLSQIFISGWPQPTTDMMVLDILIYIDKDVLLRDDIPSEFKSYISGFEDILPFIASMDIDSESIEILANKLQGLKVFFEKINIANQEDLFRKIVIEHNLFDVNHEMVTNVADVLGIELRADRVYSSILDAGDNILFNDLAMNRKLYIENIMLTSPSALNDSKEHLIKLYREKGIDLSLKKQLVEKEQAVYDDINELPTALWEHVLVRRKLKLDADNILYYYSEKGLDESLAELLNTTHDNNLLQSAFVKYTIPDGLDEENDANQNEFKKFIINFLSSNIITKNALESGSSTLN